jgi:hypothetical protein
MHLTSVSLQILLERHQQLFNYVWRNVCSVYLNFYLLSFIRRNLRI